MTLKEFVDTNWHRGNVARLKNGKEYLVKGVKGHGRYLLLYSLEYDKCFVADYRIVDCRTSDYEEPEEVYLEKKRQRQEEAKARREAERQEYLRAKAERKQRNIEEQERIHREAVARKAAAKALRQQALEAKKEMVKAAPAKTEPVKEEATTQNVPTKEAPTQEAPTKRVRQRIRITAATPMREKVEFFKKK